MKGGAKILCGALGSLEKAGIVHGRISPKNLLLGKDGNSRRIVSLKGLHRSCLSAEMNAAAVTVVKGGTIAAIPLLSKEEQRCASPELLMGNRGTSQSDVWSLGTILYLMACGKLPYSSQEEVVCGRALQFPPTHNLSASFKQLVSSMLAKDPA